MRIKDIAPDPKTKIVVNCAGRTRSIIGAQTLIDFGVENEVVALENGTQGWFLAGLHLDHGAERRYPEQPAATTDRAGLAHRARALALKHAVTFATAEQAAAWLKQPSRTTFLLDVRAAEEVAAASAGPSFVHAPGGQLVQATDNWVGVKGARLLLADADQVRAPVIAAWLRQLGHEAVVLEGGLAAAQRLQRPLPASPAPAKPLRSIEAGELAALLAKGTVQLIDLRPSMTFRKGHIAGAKWSIRPRMAATVKDRSATVVLVSDDGATAALAAVDLGEAGISDVRILAGGQAAWLAAGHAEVATPNDPPDTERIDFLFFTAKRHDGDREAAQQYLAWEQSLIGQLDAQERGVFRIE